MATSNFEGEEFKFPDEANEKAEQDDQKDDFLVEVEGETLEHDQDRNPIRKGKVDKIKNEALDGELDEYSKGVQRRIKHIMHGYHDERRAKEQALRERQAAEQFARQVYEENKKLKEQLSNGSKAYIEIGRAHV